MKNQNLNQENQNQTNNQDPKPKRWKRMQEAHAEQQEAPTKQATAEQAPLLQKTVTRDRTPV